MTHALSLHREGTRDLYNSPELNRGKSSEFFEASEERGYFLNPRTYMTTRICLHSVLRPWPLFEGGARNFSKSHRLYIVEELGIFPSPRAYITIHKRGEGVS